MGEQCASAQAPGARRYDKRPCAVMRPTNPLYGQSAVFGLVGVAPVLADVESASPCDNLSPTQLLMADTNVS